MKHTHRIHVPIDTCENGELVDFLVGPNEKNMSKYLFDEGRVVELNNQAKHAVNNNLDRYRTHLIFDYVDEHPITRIPVQPQEKVYQTRRSIDLASDAGSGKRCPTFVILGAQKSGTTTLYEFIGQHPLVVKGKRRESHFFDWRWPKNGDQLSSEEAYEQYMHYFHQQVLHSHASLISGESTPSYIFHYDLSIQRIKSICPWSKLFIILRNPVDRAYSQYQMCVSLDGDPAQLAIRGRSSYVGKSFKQAVEEEIQELKSCGISPTISSQEFIEKIVKKRPMGHGGHSIVARGLYCLQIRPFLEAFGENQLKVNYGKLKSFFIFFVFYVVLAQYNRNL